MYIVLWKGEEKTECEKLIGTIKRENYMNKKILVKFVKKYLANIECWRSEKSVHRITEGDTNTKHWENKNKTIQRLYSVWKDHRLHIFIYCGAATASAKWAFTVCLRCHCSCFHISFFYFLFTRHLCFSFL